MVLEKKYKGDIKSQPTSGYYRQASSLFIQKSSKLIYHVIMTSECI